MNGNLRLTMLTVLAPVAWGTTYLTVTELLPAGRPLFVAAVRVLPAGLVLVLIGRARSGWRPRGDMWWRTAVLALCNFALFFPLLIAGVYRLPGGVAASFGGLQPMLVAGLTWLVAGRRPGRSEVATGLVAALGVALVVVRPGATFDVLGLAAAGAATLAFASGVVLTKRWPAPTDRLAATGWQLLLGGVPLALVAVLVEGVPPALDARAVVGFTHLSLIGTALAYVLWFRGIERLPTAAPPLLGLAAPITGATLGWLVVGESLSPVQVVGFALTIGAIARGALLGARRTSSLPAVDPDDRPLDRPVLVAPGRA